MPTYHTLFKQRKAPRPRVPPTRIRAVRSEISTGLPTPRQQARLSRTPEHVLVDNAVRYRQRQRGMQARQLNQQAIGLYKQGKHREAMALHQHALNLIGRGHHISGSERLFNKIVSGTVGQHGLLGAAEEFVQGVNPVPAVEQISANIAHPLRRLGQGGQEIIPFGPGRGLPKPGEFITRPRTRVEAEARLAEIDAAQAKLEKAIQGKYKAIEPVEQLRRNKINGLLRQGEEALKKGKRPPAGYAWAKKQGPQKSLSSEFDPLGEFIAKNPKHPVVKAYLKRQQEGEQLRQALNPQHLPGEGPGTERVPFTAEELQGKREALGAWRSDLQRRKHEPGGPEKVQRHIDRLEREIAAGFKEVAVKPPPEKPGQFGYVREPARKPMEPVRPVKAIEQEMILKTPAEQAQLLREGLAPGARAYAEQKKLRSEELSSRFGRYGSAFEAARGGEAGLAAGKHELRGELPKGVFEKFGQGTMTQADLDALINRIHAHPDLLHGQALNASVGLADAYHYGKPLAPAVVRDLRVVFGEDKVNAMQQASLLRRFGVLTVDTLNVPRALMASFDLSAPFRQGLVAGAAHPGIFFRNFGSMVRAFGSENVYRAILDEIHSRPTYPLMDGRIAFTELGRPLSKREEGFMSNMAERIPGVGHIVRASGRAYTGFLDKLRADVFDHLLEVAREQGINVESPRELNGIAKWVNWATGRGDLGPVNEWAPALNAIFFSPRLIASRVGLLGGALTGYPTLTPFARAQAYRGMTRLAGAAALILELSSLAGAKVVTDPRNADFGKMKIGNTRIDILGGFQQYVRASAQIASGKRISSTTGKTIKLGSGFGQENRGNIIWDFVRSKFSPPFSVGTDLVTGKDYQGNPINYPSEVGRHLVPLALQDAYDMYNQRRNLPAAAGAYGLSAVGFGTQTYGPRPVAKEQAKKAKQASKEQNVHLENLVKKGVLPKSQLGEYREALDVYNQRTAINNVVDSKVDTDHPVTRETEKILKLIGLLEKNKIKSPAGWSWQQYRHHYKTAKLSAKEISKDRAWLWRQSGYANMIRWYNASAGRND